MAALETENMELRQERNTVDYVDCYGVAPCYASCACCSAGVSSNLWHAGTAAAGCSR
jgi:hypothetical protein